MDKVLNIITWDVPYPANYGGAIDVWYKIRAFHEEGIKIILHCFEYGNRKRNNVLNKYCQQVFYYSRKNYLQFLFSSIPFIVASRKHKELLKNLCLNDYPILMEGAHCTGFLQHKKLANRKIFIRIHNHESVYYKALAENSTNLFKKIYYQTESNRLQNHEKKFSSATALLALSLNEKDWFLNLNKHTFFIPPFHAFNDNNSLIGKGEYCLYHGNLQVVENEKAALWLIENVFNNLKIPFIIAGSNPSKALINALKNYKHIRLISNPNADKMKELIKNAQIHVLPTFQNTGMKLKLLYALYNGRFVIANNEMLSGSELQDLCFQAQNAAEWKEKIIKYFLFEFNKQMITERTIKLQSHFSNETNALKIIKQIYH